MKYGFYSRKIRRVEKNDLDKVEYANSLRDEILMLKVAIQRVWELASSDTKDLDRWIAALNVLSQAVTHQSRLLWIQAQINGDGESEVNQEIAEAIRKVTEEYDSYE